MGWIIERGMVPVNCEIAIFDLKGALAPQDKPLMLQPVLFCPVLTWAAQELMDCGVQRYFIVCPENCRQEVLDDLPGCDVTFFDHAEAALSAAGEDEGRVGAIKIRKADKFIYKHEYYPFLQKFRGTAVRTPAIYYDFISFHAAL